MSDSPGWYSAQYHSEPTAEAPFGLSALKLTPNAEMQRFLEAGGTMMQWLTREKK